MISVVVIGRNEGERLERCIKSVHDALSDQAYELIYVDSHSQDDSVRVAARSGARCFLPVTEQTTAALGRSIGAREAKGEWILFLDGDMTLEPGFVQAAVSAMREGGFQGACGIRRDVYMRDGQVTGKIDNYFGCRAARRVIEFGGAVLLERETLERAGGWAADVEAGEEAELHARLNRCGARVIELPVPMITHTDCVQGVRGVLGTIFSRRRLGNGQAFRHALSAGSAAAYIAREKALFIPFALDLACLLGLVAALIQGAGVALTILICATVQLLQALAFARCGRARGFVSAKLFFVAMPMGMLLYSKRDTAYCEWTV